jgi:hypothetical protein
MPSWFIPPFSQRDPPVPPLNICRKQAAAVKGHHRPLFAPGSPRCRGGLPARPRSSGRACSRDCSGAPPEERSAGPGCCGNGGRAGRTGRTGRTGGRGGDRKRIEPRKILKWAATRDMPTRLPGSPAATLLSCGRPCPHRRLPGPRLSPHCRTRSQCWLGCGQRLRKWKRVVTGTKGNRTRVGHGEARWSDSGGRTGRGNAQPIRNAPVIPKGRAKRRRTLWVKSPVRPGPIPGS